MLPAAVVALLWAVHAHLNGDSVAIDGPGDLWCHQCPVGGEVKKGALSDSFGAARDFLYQKFPYLPVEKRLTPEEAHERLGGPALQNMADNPACRLMIQIIPGVPIGPIVAVVACKIAATGQTNHEAAGRHCAVHLCRG